jgi:beta-glucosidase
MPENLNGKHDVVDARDPQFEETLLNGAIEGHVLVKNVGKTLPLKRPKMLSIFGYSAKAPDTNVIDGAGITRWGFGAQSANFSDLQTGFLGGGTPGTFSGVATNGTLISGGGSGATSTSLFSAPFDAIKEQALADGTMLFWDLQIAPEEIRVNGASDACLVFGNAWATEGFDRPGLEDEATNKLIKDVADECSNTIVVLHNAGARLVDSFVDHANVTAIIFAHLPGQYSGRALVSLLYGQANPSGKLPYTVAKKASDYGGLEKPDRPGGRYPQSDFGEGLLLDYRHFDAAGIEPRYEFGFGLSYTTFAYSDLQVARAPGANAAEFPTGQVLEGGHADLWDVLATVRAVVTNTGDVSGAEVAQLYVSMPGAGTNGTPVRVLRGFAKPIIAAGATATVEFKLTRRDLSSWDVAAQAWRLSKGQYGISVGGSSRKLTLKGALEMS